MALAAEKKNTSDDSIYDNVRRKLASDQIVKGGGLQVDVKAGVVTPEGKAKYTGMHSLRHFYASWCINRRADGGMELPLKTVRTPSCMGNM